MPVGCCNDSFAKNSPAVFSQSMRMKSGEVVREEEEEDESVTSSVVQLQSHTISQSRPNKGKNTCTMKD